MTPNYDNVPDWCRPGETVAVFTDRANVGHEATVKRVTKTQVVVARAYGDGEREDRYRIDGPDRRPFRHGKGAFASTHYLAPPDAADVVAARERERVARIAGQVHDLAMRWHRVRDQAAARQVADLLVQAGVILSYQPPEEGNR